MVATYSSPGWNQFRKEIRIVTKFRSIPVALLALLAATLLVQRDAFQEIRAPESSLEFRALEPGLDYAQLRKRDGPLSVHVLRIDRTRRGWEWTTALAEGRVYGLSPVTKMVRMTANWLAARPVAAINGDWFEIAPGNYQGDPRGVQIVEGELVSAPAPHTCFWVDAKGKLQMGVVESRLRVAWPDGKTETAIGLNEHRPEDGAVLYTPALGHHPSDLRPANQSTRTVDGREFILERDGDQPWLPFQAGKTYPARVARVRETGNAPLGPRSVILSLGPKLLDRLPQVQVGDLVTLKLNTAPDLVGARSAIGGGPHLVRESKEQTLDQVARDRHPRSLLGWNWAHVFLAVVDGRQPQLSVGMTYRELAALAAQLGCTEAMALDGGGSSTLWADGRVLNSPSDGEPRGVANALILVERKPASSPP
jgi:hypothetical protein